LLENLVGTFLRDLEMSKENESTMPKKRIAMTRVKWKIRIPDTISDIEITHHNNNFVNVGLSIL